MNDFNCEQYLVNELLREFKPRPKVKNTLFTGIDGREYGHRHHNTMSIGNQLRTALVGGNDVDNYVKLREMARSPHMKSKRNR